MTSVSVIIPSYNHAQYIEATVRSVLRQTLPDIEIVIVDDGSTDDSKTIVRELIAKTTNNRILYEETENNGAHAAINKAISLASGNILAILNSDDMFEPQRLERILDVTPSSGPFVAFSEIEYIDGTGKSLPVDSDYPRWYSKILRDTSHYPGLGFGLMLHNYSISSSNYIFSREMFSLAGPFRNFRTVNDIDFLLRCAFHVEPIFIRSPLLRYRVHSESTLLKNKDILNGEEERVISDYFGLVADSVPGNRLAPGSDRLQLYTSYFVQHKEGLSTGKKIADIIGPSSWSGPIQRNDDPESVALGAELDRLQEQLLLLHEAERLKKDWYEPELHRLRAELSEAERAKEEHFVPEIDRLRAGLADAERVRKDYFVPEIDRLRAGLAEAEAVKNDYFVPEIERLSTEIATHRKSWQVEVQKFRQQLLFHTEQSDVARRRAALDREELAAMRKTQEDWWDPELKRLATRVAEFEQKKEEWWDPELERRAGRIAELEQEHEELEAMRKIKEEYWDPELERRAGRIAELEQKQEEWWEPELERRAGQIAELEQVQDIAVHSVQELIRLAGFELRRLANYEKSRFARLVVRPSPAAGTRPTQLDDLILDPTVMRILVEASGLFDPDWYSAQNADVVAAREAPLDHYLAWGCKEGRSPGPNFDAAAYLASNSDLTSTNIPPLIHYLVYGVREGRRKSPVPGTSGR